MERIVIVALQAFILSGPLYRILEALSVIRPLGAHRIYHISSFLVPLIDLVIEAGPGSRDEMLCIDVRLPLVARRLTELL
jgi:hypothetical protein